MLLFYIFNSIKFKEFYDIISTVCVYAGESFGIFEELQATYEYE